MLLERFLEHIWAVDAKRPEYRLVRRFVSQDVKRHRWTYTSLPYHISLCSGVEVEWKSTTGRGVGHRFLQSSRECPYVFQQFWGNWEMYSFFSEFEIHNLGRFQVLLCTDDRSGGPCQGLCYHGRQRLSGDVPS
jgi:hypothetical protein